MILQDTLPDLTETVIALALVGGAIISSVKKKQKGVIGYEAAVAVWYFLIAEWWGVLIWGVFTGLSIWTYFYQKRKAASESTESDECCNADDRTEEPDEIEQHVSDLRNTDNR